MKKIYNWKQFQENSIEKKTDKKAMNDNETLE